MFKKISLILLSIALVVSAGVSVLFGFNTNTAKADGEAITEFSAVTGASVRVSDRSGIRFTVNVPTSVYDSVVSGGAYVNDSQIGMIIVPYAYVTDYNAYKASNSTSDYGYYEYFKNVKGKMVNLTYTPEQVAANPVSGGYQIKGSLVDIKEANLERDFVGIGYVRTSGRYTYTAITEDDNARNITEIATKAIEDNSGKVSASQRGLLSSLYNIDYYTVSYKNINLSDEYHVNNAYGTNYALPADIIAEGYNFKGCKVTANGEEYTVTGGKLDRDITVTGNWTADIAEYDIPYDIDNAVAARETAHRWTSEEIATTKAFSEEKKSWAFNYTEKQDGETPFAAWSFDWQARLHAVETKGNNLVVIPKINFNNYDSVYFYVYSGSTTTNLEIKVGATAWGTWDSKLVGTITSGSTSNYAIVKIEGGKIYFKMNNAENYTACEYALSDDELSGTESIIFTFKNNILHSVISDFFYDGLQYERDMTGVKATEYYVRETAHRWTSEEIAVAKTFSEEKKSWAFNYTEKQDGEKPFAAWSFDWQARLHAVETKGNNLVVIPKINFNDYGSAYFYVYSGPTTANLEIKVGATAWGTWDSKLVGTIPSGSASDYAIVKIEGGKIYFKMNAAENYSDSGYTLSDGESSGTESVIFTFKNNILHSVISDFFYDKKCYNYELDYVAAAKAYAETVTTDGTTAEKLAKLEKYNFYKNYIDGNAHSKSGYVEPATITALKNSITDETIVEASINAIEVSTTLSTGKKVTAGTGNTANTWYNNQGNGNNIGAYVELQVVEDSTNANGFIKAGGRQDAILDYTLTLPVINYKQYCSQYGAVQFIVKGNGFAMTYNGTKFSDVANSIEQTITICDGKLFANGSFVALLDETVYEGTNALSLDITRGKANTYGWITISDVKATTNFTYNDIATLIGRYTALSGEILEGVSEDGLVGFDQSAPNFVSASKNGNEVEALYFSSLAARNSSFGFNKTKATKGISFDYLITANSSFNAKISYLGSSGLSFDVILIADGRWHTAEISRKDGNFGGFSVLIEKFVGKMLVSNVNVYDIDTYTVTFANSDVVDTTVSDGETVSAPEVKPASGYTLLRWDTLSGEKYDFSTPVTGNLVLVARYTVYGESGEKETVASWSDAVELTGFSDWKNANITDWTGTTGKKDGVEAKNSKDFTLPKIDYRQYGAVSFKVTLNWANMIVKYRDTVIANLTANGGTYAQPTEIRIVGQTIICGNNTATLTSDEYKGRLGVPLSVSNGTNSKGNVIFSHFSAYVLDYRNAAENFSVTLSGSETADELFAYLNEYNSYKSYFTTYELENEKEPDCVAAIKSALAGKTARILDNTGSGKIKITYTDSVNGVLENGRSSGAAILSSGSKYNIQKKDSATSEVILDYVVTVPELNYVSLNKKYSVVYFTICGGNADKVTLTAYGTTIFDGTTGKEKADIIVLDGKIYVNGIFKVNIPAEVYTGYSPLEIAVKRQEGDTYCMAEISDVIGAASYDGLIYEGKNDDAYDYNRTEETITLVNNGQTDYQIYYAAEGGIYETNTFDRRVLGIATSDLARFFKEATGADISVNTYASAAFDVSEKAIVVGRLSEGANLGYDGLTTDTGYKIVREGNSVFIYGKTSNGAANGVYAFLNKYFGYEFYTDEVYTYETVDEVKIKSLEEVFNPDIDYIFASGSAVYGLDYTDNTYPFEYQYRLGYATDHYVTGGNTHNFLTLISEDKYKAEHPNWFTTENWYGANNWYNGQPRSGAVASGTFTTLNLSYNDYEMVSTVAGLIAGQVNADNWNGRKYFTFSQPDRLGWSTATTSKAVYNKYGTYSAEYIIFMNKLAKYIEENCNLKNEVTLQILAYGAIVEAPAYSDELALYSGSKVKVGVMYAPIERNNMLSIEDGTVKGVINEQYNSYYAEQFKKWQALAVNSGEIGYWNYTAYTDSFFTPFDSITNKQADYKFAKSLGVKVIKDQGQVGNAVTTGSDWDTLKNYIKVKLAKNVNEDVETLIKNFCDAYYGAASPFMQTLLKTERDWINGTLKDRAVTSGKSNLGISDGAAWINTSGNKKYWDEGTKKWYQTSYTYDSSMLTTWYGYIANALEAAKGNTELENRVKAEGLTVRYLLAKVYSDTTYGAFDDIKADAKTIGMRYYAEGKKIDDLA